MLTEAQMEIKLRKYADQFCEAAGDKDWGKAHNLYNIIRNTTVMAEMSEEFMEELFGSYDSEDFPRNDGIIRRTTVDRVNRESCIRRNMAYEDMECRRMSADPGELRYYSEENYCAGCRKRITKK